MKNNIQNGLRLLSILQNDIENKFLGKTKDEVFDILLESCLFCEYDNYIDRYLVKYPFSESSFQIIFNENEICTSILLW